MSLIETLTEEQIIEFKAAFAPFDKNGEGTIETKDFEAIMRSLGQNPSAAELQDMLDEVDKEGKGTIDFLAFLGLMARKMMDYGGEVDLIEPFRAYDRDGNGLISTEDLRKVIKEMENEVSDEDMEEMMREADADENGKVNYEDFVRKMMSK